MHSLSPEKSVLRKEMIARRLALAPQEHAALSARIAARILADMPVPATVALYMPHKGEVDVMPLMQALHARGHVCAVPRLAGDALIFARWQPQAAVTLNRFGIVEPAVQSRVTPRMVIVPMAGFGRDGYRLGYGGGYYDRTLAGLQAPVVGVAFSFQECVDPQLDNPLRGLHDVNMDIVVTDRETIAINNKRITGEDTFSG